MFLVKSSRFTLRFALRYDSSYNGESTIIDNVTCSTIYPTGVKCYPLQILRSALAAAHSWNCRFYTQQHSVQFDCDCTLHNILSSNSLIMRLSFEQE